jgi:hypothetical protein
MLPNESSTTRPPWDRHHIRICVRQHTRKFYAEALAYPCEERYLHRKIERIIHLSASR